MIYSDLYSWKIKNRMENGKNCIIRVFQKIVLSLCNHILYVLLALKFCGSSHSNCLWHKPKDNCKMLCTQTETVFELTFVLGSQSHSPRVTNINLQAIVVHTYIPHLALTITLYKVTKLLAKLPTTKQTLFVKKISGNNTVWNFNDLMTYSFLYRI